VGVLAVRGAGVTVGGVVRGLLRGGHWASLPCALRSDK
jgi:hypothetical protein